MASVIDLVELEITVRDWSEASGRRRLALADHIVELIVEERVLETIEEQAERIEELNEALDRLRHGGGA